MSKTDLVPATTTATSVPARLQPVSGADDYIALSMPVQEYLETLQENTGSSTFTRAMLDRIKFPNGETTFTIKDTLAGEDVEHAALDVIVLAIQPTRTLWAGNYDPNNTEPPACRSYDGETGIGKYGVDSDNPENPSGMCATCPMAKFGSKGKGQACQLKHDLYFLTQGSMTPSIMTLPVTSGKPLKEFRAALTKAAIPLFGAVVTIKANKVKGAPYSIASFALKHVLPREEVAALRVYSQNVKDHLIAGPAQDEDGDETAVEGSVSDATAVELPF